MGTGVQPSLWPRLPELTLPTLLITGELDQKFVAIARRMAERMGQGPARQRLEIVPAAGHTVHLEKPILYTKIIKEWLESI
jgi:2-succinyl-6-hydroxy-2,4-cyclohexadiene-1-carboxylate synthase